MKESLFVGPVSGRSRWLTLESYCTYTCTVQSTVHDWHTSYTHHLHDEHSSTSRRTQMICVDMTNTHPLQDYHTSFAWHITHVSRIAHTHSVDSLLDSIHMRDSLTIDFKTVYHRSLLQNIVTFIGLLCKRDLWFEDSLLDSIDMRDSLTIDFKTVYYRSLLQNIVTFIGLFCKRDLWFEDSLLDSRDMRDSLTIDFKTVYHRSLLQNTVTFIGLFCKRDLWFQDSVLHTPWTYDSTVHPKAIQDPTKRHSFILYVSFAEYS